MSWYKIAQTSEPYDLSNTIVVDKNGNPLTVYHGTEKEFDVFDPKKQRGGDFGNGFYFTDNYDVAKAWSRGGVVKAVHLLAHATALDVIKAKIEGRPVPKKDINIQPYRGGKVYMVQDPSQIVPIKDIFPNVRVSPNEDIIDTNGGES